MTGISVIVPVRNEASRIAGTAASLMSGLPASAELIFVLNGCVDDSEKLLRETCGDRARIITSTPGKAHALNAGDALASQFPRFYIDADVDITGSAIAALASHLDESGAMLVSPRLEYDLSGASFAARLINQTWIALPHARAAAFHQVIGVSEAGRARWGKLPEIIADDSYIVAAIPPHERFLARDIVARVRLPWTLNSYVKVRSRWRAGQRQLRAMGVEIPYQPGQKSALLRMMTSPKMLGPALLYAAAVIGGDLLALLGRSTARRWYQDVSTR